MSDEDVTKMTFLGIRKALDYCYYDEVKHPWKELSEEEEYDSVVG